MTDIEKKIVEYSLTFPGAYLDYPFHDDIAAIRHRQNKKTFLFIIKRSGQIWVNMKCEPMKADFWRSVYTSVTRGYHMNDKASWNTVIMDGSVPWDVMEEMIGDSYDRIKPKPKKQMREQNPQSDFPGDAKILEKLACSLSRNDEEPNIELAVSLCNSEDRNEISEIVAGLKSKSKAVASDCIKVLYEIASRKPQLVAGYAADFIALLSSRDNRLVWGGMTALAEIAHLCPGEIFDRIDQIITAYENGSVITRDNSMTVFAKVCKADSQYETRILPLLLRHLETCRSKEVPQHAERISICFSDENASAVFNVLQQRTPELTPAQKKRIEKLAKIWSETR